MTKLVLCCKKQRDISDNYSLFFIIITQKPGKSIILKWSNQILEKQMFIFGKKSRYMNFLNCNGSRFYNIILIML